MSAIPNQEADAQSVRTSPAGTPEEEATTGMAWEPAMEKRPPNKFPVWEKVLHPFQPVVATGRFPSSKSPRLRHCSWKEGLVQIPQTKKSSVMTTQEELPSLTEELEVIW